MKKAVSCLTAGVIFLLAASPFWFGRFVQAPAAEPSTAASTTTPATLPITNSIGIKLVKIPAGDFTMGNQEPIEKLRKDYPQYDDYRFNTVKDEIAGPQGSHHEGILHGSLCRDGRAVPAVRRRPRTTPPTPSAMTRFPARDQQTPGPWRYGYNAETGKLDEDRNPKHNWRNVGFPKPTIIR